MEKHHKLGLIVSYYLSRFNREAYKHLALGNQSQTHTKIGEKMGINPHTIKNWRDEFDPIHDHRAGWYQRPMSPSRISIVNGLQALSEPELREYVLRVLQNPFTMDNADVASLLSLVDDTNENGKRTFGIRSVTGRKAEEYFIEFYKNHQLPVAGELRDMRDHGVGYDFEIISLRSRVFVEVKGISGLSGGVLFTSKEWEVAYRETVNYFLALVTIIDGAFKMTIIPNPFTKFTPKMNLIKTVQVNYSIADTELKKFMTHE